MFPSAGGKKPIPGAAAAAREGLRTTNKIFDTLARSYNNMPRVRAEMQAANGNVWARNTAGMFVRKLGHDWRNQVLCGLILDLSKTWKDDETVPCTLFPVLVLTHI